MSKMVRAGYCRSDRAEWADHNDVELGAGSEMLARVARFLSGSDHRSPAWVLNQDSHRAKLPNA